MLSGVVVVSAVVCCAVLCCAVLCCVVKCDLFAAYVSLYSPLLMRAPPSLTCAPGTRGGELVTSVSITFSQPMVDMDAVAATAQVKPARAVKRRDCCVLCVV